MATSKKGCILVDPGADVEHICSRLSAMNMKPHAIILTHGHLDHISAAGELKRRFNGIPVCIHPADAAFLDDSSRERHIEAFQRMVANAEDAVARLYRALPQPDVLLEDGAEIPDTDFTVIHTPGHTPGSVCYYSEQRAVLFSGDTLYLSAGTDERADGDQAQLVESITARLFALPEETRLFPGHGPLSTLEREMRNKSVPMRSVQR